MTFYERVAAISQLASAIAFAAVLVWIWFKTIMPAIRAAQEAENKHIAETQRHLEEQRTAIGVLHTEIDGAKRDAEAIRARAIEQAEHERTAALAEAREAGERALRNADGELERARFAARDRLRTEILERALELARGEAVKRVDAAANAKLIAGFTSTLERENA